ncbi:hypothetical protein [Salinimicrobium gaetbulicola]|uniref:SnoaL-like domain-containing protein n=1 Tax=Salinimicrobium gaetbulicola TaxID=999702 RepID=A0ABW3IET4_9FLAO
MEKLKMNLLKGLLPGACMLFLTPAIMAQDPVKEDPKHYKVELDNDEVRVLRINYGPGEESVMHKHPKGVVVFLTDAKVDFTLPNGQTAPMTTTAGDVIWTEEDSHKPKNTAGQPLEAIQIEFKSKETGAGEMQEARYTTSSPMIDLVKKGLMDYEKKDWDSWKAQFGDDARIFHNNWDESVSPDEFIEDHSGFLDNFSSYEFVDEPAFFEQIIDDKGQKWVYFWGIWEGTLKSNRQNLKIPVHLALMYKDGKIVEEYGFYDMSPFWKAMQESKK